LNHNVKLLQGEKTKVETNMNKLQEKEEKDTMQKADEDVCNANLKAYPMSPLMFTNMHT
jgi:hypothetical protein